MEYPLFVGWDAVADLAVFSALTKTCLDGTEYHGDDDTAACKLSCNNYNNNPQENKPGSITKRLGWIPSRYSHVSLSAYYLPIICLNTIALQRRGIQSTAER